jgi:hypothetical protein
MTPMVKAKFSDHYEAVRSRIRRLPVLLQSEVENLSYNDAVHLIELFKEGIKAREFKLKPLRPATINSKRRRGYTKPDTPLYGTNRRKNRYNNMMEIIKDGNRWIVRPRKQKHWHASIGLDVMFDVHEYGATIMGKSRSGTPVRIRIPPRPAFRYAYNKMLREKALQEQAGKLQEKIVQYIKTGSWKAQKRRNLKDTI